MKRKTTYQKPALRRFFETFGIGIVYHMVFIPRIFATKTGFTGWSIRKRREGVSKAAPGIAVPIAFVAMPFAYQAEQLLLFIMSGIRHDFYKGQGHTETHLFFSHAIVLPFMAVVWWLEYEVFIFLRDSAWVYLTN